MRIGKRTFRHKLRYGFHPHFNKRGDKIHDPFSKPIDAILTGASVSMTKWKYDRLMKEYRLKYLLKFKGNYRIVGSVHLPTGIWVSTVCLMINHAFHDPAVPILFETMVFSPDDTTDGRRYCTLHEAREGHKKFVNKYKKYKLKPGKV